MLRVLDLFSGIGGFSLGLERTGGFRTVAFCEIEEYPRRVLEKHWPGVPIYHDVRELTADTLRRDGIAVDAICGGFPCQDISIAGRGAGVDGERSVLWREYARLIGELRPSYAIMENSPALLARGLGKILGELAALGYDAEWHCIPAAAVGADHLRDRIWIVAYPNKELLRDEPGRRRGARRQGSSIARDNGQARALADSNQGHRNGRNSALQMGWGASAAETIDAYHEGRAEWPAQPGVGRTVHGVSHRVERCGALGNAVVPQIPEMIGRAILEAAE
jgi:DNA (cytosine-5)-methyltransferase 1